MEASTFSHSAMTQPAPSGVDRCLKINVVVLDGKNLHNSKILEWYPAPPGRPALSADDDSTWGERHSWMLREILDFVCRSDSRFYGRKHDVLTEDYRDLLRMYQNPSSFVKRRPVTYVIEQTIWFVVKSQYRFQRDNMYNQMEDVCVHILNICMREIRREAFVIGPHILYLALREYHNRLFANYFKWCDYLDENPFPWRHPPWLENSTCAEDAIEDTPLTSVTVVEAKERMSGCADILPPSMRRNMQKMMYEVVLFKLLWGEAFNLRHTPEFLCWMFHWLCLAWSPTFIAEENFVDLIKDVLQRARDEQWYLANALRSPDHCSRLLYDDINEVFWERDAIRLLDRAKQNTEMLYNMHQCSEANEKPTAGTAEAPEANAFPSISSKENHEAREARLRLDVTRDNLNLVVESLLYATEPGKGIKTFLERRTYLQHVPVYLQVLRSFWRVLAWQCVSFAFLFYLRALIDDEPTEVLSYCWNRGLFTAITCHAFEPILDLLLANWRALRKKHFWRFFLRESFLNILRLIFFFVSLLMISLEGLHSSVFSWKGPIGATYLLFYSFHGFHYYLYVRISGAMPFFHFLWGLPFISTIAKPSTFTGNTPLLAEDLTHVVKYVFFWVPILVIKLGYWLFFVLPELLEAAKHIEAAAARPFLVGPMAMSFEENPVVLRLVLWAPALLLWIFDLQIFFILSGAVYGSFQGCWRRVSFFKSIRKIQKRLLPVLSSVPIFEPETMYKPKTELQGGARLAYSNLDHETKPNKPTMNRAYSRAESTHIDPPDTSQAHLTLQRSTTKIQYRNRTDPYKNMVPLLNTRSLANMIYARKHIYLCLDLCLYSRLLPGQSLDDAAMARKSFGFLWNEVVHSWRQEDIISNAELNQLLFNELPLIDIPNDDWAVTRLDKKFNFIQWERSTFRLPVYCYCDVVFGFLKTCELFHHQVKDEIARFSSRKAAASQFFREHISDDPTHQDSRFKDSLHIEAGAEIAEALFLYLSRYFERGVGLVDSIVDLWNWVKEDGSRLLWISMISLKEIATALEQLFAALQTTGNWGEKEHAHLETINVILEQRLLTLIELPTDDPADAENEALPEVIKEYLNSIKLCFNSSRTGCFPSLYPHPVDVEEVNAMIQYLQIIMSHTRQLHVVEHDCFEERRNLIPMTIEQMAEARCLHNLLIQAEADVVADRQAHEQHERENADAKKHLGHVEHAVKMYFRRGARILRASNPFLTTPEADRRLKQFANSLLMEMPGSPEVHRMISMATLTPYYREDTVLDVNDLEEPTEEGVSKMELLRSLHPQELDNFLERVDRDKDMFTIHQELENRVADSALERKQALKEVRRQMLQNGLLERYDRFCEVLQEWASYRGQVLMRTVRGMMYHEHAIKMQAYLEQKSYANLHLCHDLNRLDFEQQKVLNSPEIGLWKEVLAVPPAYELCPVVAAMTRLKYQYIVAAQEFGMDILTQPSRGRELTGEARSRLLRKLWGHKLLFRHPNLRVATVEPERDAGGVPTGHKLGKLYRLSTTPDCMRQYIRTPKPHVPRAPTHASTYRKHMDLDVADAADMPKPRAQHPHMQFDPDDGSTLSENFTINTRSGGKSSGAPSDRGVGISGGTAKKQYPEPGGESDREGERPSETARVSSRATRDKGFDAQFSVPAQHGSRISGTPQNDGVQDVVTKGLCLDPQPAEHHYKEVYEIFHAKGDRHMSRTALRSAGFPSTSCCGNFQSDVANLIQKTHERRAKDQQAAASMHRLARRVSGKELVFSSEICSDHTLRFGTSLETETQEFDRRPVATRNVPAHSAVRQFGSHTPHKGLRHRVGVTTLHSHSTTEVDTPGIRWSEGQSNASEYPDLSEIQDSYFDDDESTFDNSSEDEITEFYGHAEGTELTLLTCQHTRELARDRNSVVAWKLTSSEFLGNGCCEPSREISANGGNQASPCEPTGDSNNGHSCSRSKELTAHFSGPDFSSLQSPAGKQRRRHSIITLHPVSKPQPFATGREFHLGRNVVDPGGVLNIPRLTRPRKLPCESRSGNPVEKEATGQYTVKWDSDRLLRSSSRRRFHMDSIHAIEPVGSPSQVHEELQGRGRLRKIGHHRSNNHDSPAQQMTGKGTDRDYRRSSLDDGIKLGSPLAFARRVAMFEEYFKRKKNNELYARLYKQSALRGRRAVRRNRPLLWMSSRGPMGLQAVYTLRLPLIVNEDRQPWDKFPLIGPGKPENQNHAMAFTRMETLQVVDMNMEGYLEEALKLRNLLQEFVAHPRVRILGFREHIFTENVSSLASFMALQENVFTTTNQRLYHEPLQVRMHYGHPDVFDRFFVQTCGSCSKSSKQLHLSEDVFAGFNCTARGYCIRHVDYIQCGKGRDVGLQQVVMFERKVAGGNAEQMLSRDVCRMAKNMDFFRLLSLYFSGPGFFFSAIILFLAAYVSLYVKCMFSFSQYKYKGVTESALRYVVAPTTYVQFHLGLLLLLPLIVWLLAEKGFWTAISRMVDIVLKFAIAYYNFMIGTKAMIIDHVLLYGGARYQETGRGFVVTHMSMRELWQLYYFTHFSVGLEMTFLLLVYARFCGFNAGVYFLDTWPLYLMALSLLYVPFLFNPLGMYYPRLLEDVVNWRQWMSSRDLRDEQASWFAWWRAEMEGRCNIAWHHQLILTGRLMRFLMISVGMVSCVAMTIKTSDMDCVVYLFGTAGCVLFLIIFLDDLKLASPTWNTVLSVSIFLAGVSVVGWLLVTKHITLSVLTTSSTAFLIFSYGLLEISFVILGRWAVRNDVLAEAARAFHYLGGFLVFFVPVLLSGFTLSFHKIQTRILFNPRFVTIVKSGLVQRAEVTKKGHTKK